MTIPQPVPSSMLREIQVRHPCASSTRSIESQPCSPLRQDRQPPLGHRERLRESFAMFRELFWAGDDRIRIRKPMRYSSLVKHLRDSRQAPFVPDLFKPAPHKLLVFFGHGTLQCAELTSQLPALSGGKCAFLNS